MAMFWRSATRSVFVMTVAASMTTSSMTAAVSAPPLNFDNIYNNTSIANIYLTVPDASRQALDREPKVYVAATVKIDVGGGTSGELPIGLRLKGGTSLEKLNAKPSMKVRFNWGVLAGQRFVGLKNMTLNALSQDNSRVHEFGAYRLFNAMNVPAPKTGWAEVFVNGTSKGLYLNVETPDDIFLSKRFNDVTQHLYEGVALNDLKRGNDRGGEKDGAFLVDEGWKAVPNKNDLTKLIEVANYSQPAKWWNQLPSVIDRKRMINFFAVENFLGHWDGYSGPIINNYFLRSNAQGKFTFLPWGADQTFGENRATGATDDMYRFSMYSAMVGYPWSRNRGTEKLQRGMMYQKCIAYKPCRIQYIKALKAVSDKAKSMKLVDQMKSAGNLIRRFDTQVTRQVQQNNFTFLKLQHQDVAKLFVKYSK